MCYRRISLHEAAHQEAPSCARHPAQPARAICRRCGAYMCAVCDKAGRYQNCEACRRLTGEDYFRLNRQTLTFGKAWELVWERFKVHWPMLAVGSLIVLGASFVFGLIRQFLMVPFTFTIDTDFGTSATLVFYFLILFGSMLVEMVVTATLNLGFLRMCLDVLMGRPAEVGRLFSQLRKVGKVMLQGLAAMIALGIPLVLWGALMVGFAGLGNERAPGPALAIIAFLLGLGPFIYYAVPFMFMQIELALAEDVGPVEAIVNAAVVVRGNRAIALLAVLLAGLLYFLGFVMCCIGLLVTWPLGMLLMCCVYLALRKGSEVSSPAEE